MDKQTVGRFSAASHCIALKEKGLPAVTLHKGASGMSDQRSPEKVSTTGKK
jgi:hypothetical protein